MSSWVQKIKNKAEIVQKKRSIPGGAFGAASILMQKDNIKLSERQILDAVHEDPVFYACLSLISSKIASTDIYVVDQDGQRDRTHSIQQLIEDPNYFHSKFTFFWLLSVYLLSTGSCYLYIQDDGSILPLSSRQITHQGGRDYVIKLWNSDRRKGRLGDNLAKVRLPDVREPYLTGSGYGSSAGAELDISRAAREHESAVLHNNARPDMLVNFDGVSEEQFNAVKQAWKNEHKGSQKSGKIGFFNSAGVSVETLNTSFRDLGFIDLRKHSSDVIRKSFGIPPELLGQVENSNRATIEAAFYLFSKNVLEPKLKLIISALNSNLIPMITDEKIKLSFENVVPEDKDRKMSAMQAFPNAFTVNEARRIAGYKEVEGGDVPLSQEVERMDIKEEEKSQKPINKEPLTRKIPALNNGIPEDLHLTDLVEELTQKGEKNA